MCGIIGVAGNIPKESKAIEARDAMRHRGPDDAGIFYDKKNGIMLGFRRLSIIDLTSGGHQPMASNDKRFTIIFNGEIYNYIELKEELKGSYDFKTQSDTEVLLAAYVKWGEQCLDRLNGMFSFAIWDALGHVLFAARDRVGEKPFYYHHDPKTGTLSFASEIKALLKLGVPVSPNEDMILDYLAYGFYHHTEQTFFKNIQELRGGHFLIKKGSDITIKRYWDLANIADRPRDIGEKEAIHTLRELVADSITLRFRSDVPVGINLSSGLDSNSLLYYAKKVTGHNPEMFSMCMADAKYNECAIIIDLLNNDEKKRWHTSYLTPDQVFQGAEMMNTIQDQPFGGIPTTMYAGMNEVAKKEGVTVLLEGQGVDEILAGYKYYIPEYEKDLRGGNSSSVGMSQDMSKLIGKDVVSEKFMWLKKTPEFKEPFASHLLNAQYRDIYHTKLPRVLHFNDHVSMAYSRELRLPFLDHRIIEFCFFLPPELKIRNGTQKFLMREAMKDVLPAVVQEKQKVAFGAVQNDWLKEYFRKEVYELLDSPSFQARPFWDQKKLRERVDRFYAGEGNNSFFIWQCINLELWFRAFID
ncbi:MAG: asparagine synthase (glutamine-hydrolyzing) [Patescibacteria group bacterium]